ncbi:hypothetical protein KAT92_04185, partial [Candidatus Babeliales bacterium]|nr:hypothetical protein [Candidatus Babeliales bacterium]
RNICAHYNKKTNPSDCGGHHSGLLLASEIKDLGLISSGSILPSSLKATTYDLRLGSGHYIYDNGWKPIWSDQNLENMDLVNDRSVSPHFTPTEKHNTLVIPPHGMALIQLEETVDTLSCIEDGFFVCGHFDLKLTTLAKGFISQQATQVEPGYKGKLFCYLINQTNNPIPLTTGRPIASIEFSYISCIVQCSESSRDELQEFISRNAEKYKEDPFAAKNRDGKETGINDVRYFVNKSLLPSGAGISALHKETKELHENIKATYDRTETLQNECKKDATDTGKKAATNEIKTHLKWIIPILIALVAGIYMQIMAVARVFASNDLINHMKNASEEKRKLETASSNLVENIKQELNNLHQIATLNDQSLTNQMTTLNTLKRSISNECQNLEQLESELKTTEDRLIRLSLQITKKHKP